MRRTSLKEKGITLVALVVTIIVLLILAGITINMAIDNNGLIQRAKDAKTLTERQSVVEQARTDILGYQVENKGIDLQKSQLQAILETYFKDVPDLTDMSDTEIKEKQLVTLAKYGTHTITVSEIYSGEFESNNEDNVELIHFSIETTEYTAEQGMSWGEWIESSYNIDGFKAVIIKDYNNYNYNTDEYETIGTKIQTAQRCDVLRGHEFVYGGDLIIDGAFYFIGPPVF